MFKRQRSLQHWATTEIGQASLRVCLEYPLGGWVDDLWFLLTPRCKFIKFYLCPLPQFCPWGPVEPNASPPLYSAGVEMPLAMQMWQWKDVRLGIGTCQWPTLNAHCLLLTERTFLGEPLSLLQAYSLPSLLDCTKILFSHPGQGLGFSIQELILDQISPSHRQNQKLSNDLENTINLVQLFLHVSSI